jgi:hypothetical protein
MSSFGRFEIFSFREEDELPDDHLRLMELRSVFFVDDASFESPFYIDEFSFDEEFFYLLSEWTPGDTVRILCF